MAFLDKEELRTTATVSMIDKITQQDESTVETIIEECIDEMKPYLSAYDVEAIFSAEGDARSKVILKHLKAMVTYEIFQKGGSEFGADKAYRATQWLKEVSSGLITLWLSAGSAETEDSSTSDPWFGGEESYDSEF